MNIDVSNVKRKRIEKASSNASVLGENDYFHTHMTFLNELNDQNHSNFISNDFNILNAINQANQNEDFINLITNPDLNKKLSSVKFINLDIRVVINFDCIRYFFIDRSIFTIYIKI